MTQALRPQQTSAKLQANPDLIGIFWQYIVVGVVVILAVLIDQARDLVIGRMEAG